MGCAVLTRLPNPVIATGKTSTALLDDGYEDHVGVIHIHTRYSDGAGTYEDIARVANAQRLDYLIVTDHNTLQPLRDDQQGWRGTTLVLVGMEISTRGGHYLALNVTTDIDREKMTTQEIFDAVNRQGGFGIIAHPYFKKRRWTDWGVTGFTGIEAYNIAHDTLDENRLRLALWTFSVPVEPFYLSLIDRPYDPLAKWDELIAKHGRVVGIGAADAHEVRVFGMKFAPYEIMFRLIRTHVLTPPGPLTGPAVYDALRRGHAYLSLELVDEAKGFSFLADDGQRIRGIMGDDVALEPGLRVSASLPAPATLTLFRDGRPIAVTIGDYWQVPITQPGAYRLEASRHNKPWIFSNPIYVRERTTGVTLPTESDQQSAISDQQTQPPGQPAESTAPSPEQHAQ